MFTENLCESKTKYWDEQKNQLLKIKDLSHTGAMTTGSNSAVIPKSFSTQKELQSLPKFLIKWISIYSSKKKIFFPKNFLQFMDYVFPFLQWRCTWMINKVLGPKSLSNGI